MPVETQISHSLSAELSANHSPLVSRLSSPYVLVDAAADTPCCPSRSIHVVHASNLACLFSHLVGIPCTALRHWIQL